MKKIAIVLDIKQLAPPENSRVASISLPPSKSIANRVAIILSLAGVIPSEYLEFGSEMARDTRILLDVLEKTQQDSVGQVEDSTYDAQDAGTAYRFLTARLALLPGKKILTGSPRMLERPIEPLVTALQGLGAAVEYLGKPGFPPLSIGEIPRNASSSPPTVYLDSSLSSQYASALLLIGPYLPQGLRLVLTGDTVSGSYLRMTLGLMRHFGAKVTQRGTKLRVYPGKYQPSVYPVESDWSAASYFFNVVAMSPQPVHLTLLGLHKRSLQGDSVLPKWMRPLGVRSRWSAAGLILEKSKTPVLPEGYTLDFLENPDLAQTFIVLCAGLGVSLRAFGLQTLRIKETDRIHALQEELRKIGVHLLKIPEQQSESAHEKESYVTQHQARWKGEVTFSTYQDHRMAMAFATLGMLGAVGIADPGVVRKSFPGFWEFWEI